MGVLRKREGKLIGHGARFHPHRPEKSLLPVEPLPKPQVDRLDSVGAPADFAVELLPKPPVKISSFQKKG